MRTFLFYLFRKFVSMAVTLLAVSAAVFFSFALIPGDPALRRLGTQATQESLAALREEMGLQAPLPLRYLRWLTGFLRGDMGESYSYQMPVRELLGDKVWVTLSLVGLSFLLLIVISIPLGIWHAKHEGKPQDRLGLILGQVLMAVPPFFLGILIIWLFGLVLHFFVPGGYVSWQKDPWGFFSYLFFPALAIALPRSAMTVKLLRGEILSEARRDYVRTAYSRGNPTMAVFYRHILKNAFLPVLTFLAMNLTDMVAGSVVIEQVFGIPGLGRFLLVSILGRDHPVVECIIMGLALFVILVNLATDVLYRVLDPRIGGL